MGEKFVQTFDWKIVLVKSYCRVSESHYFHVNSGRLCFKDTKIEQR